MRQLKGSLIYPCGIVSSEQKNFASCVCVVHRYAFCTLHRHNTIDSNNGIFLCLVLSPALNHWTEQRSVAIRGDHYSSRQFSPPKPICSPTPILPSLYGNADSTTSITLRQLFPFFNSLFSFIPLAIRPNYTMYTQPQSLPNSFDSPYPVRLPDKHCAQHACVP